MQKGSFWIAKGVLLEGKRSRFGRQKESFWKEALLKAPQNPTQNPTKPYPQPLPRREGSGMI